MTTVIVQAVKRGTLNLVCHHGSPNAVLLPFHCPLMTAEKCTKKSQTNAMTSRSLTVEGRNEDGLMVEMAFMCDTRLLSLRLCDRGPEGP